MEKTPNKLDNTTSKPGVKALLYEARFSTDHAFIAEHKLKEDLAAVIANMGFAQIVTKVGSNLGGNETLWTQNLASVK